MYVVIEDCAYESFDVVGLYNTVDEARARMDALAGSVTDRHTMLYVAELSLGRNPVGNALKTFQL
jgi:hypothetical protein